MCGICIYNLSVLINLCGHYKCWKTRLYFVKFKSLLLIETLLWWMQFNMFFFFPKANNLLYLFHVCKSVKVKCKMIMFPKRKPVHVMQTWESIVFNSDEARYYQKLVMFEGIWSDYSIFYELHFVSMTMQELSLHVRVLRGYCKTAWGINVVFEKLFLSWLYYNKMK